MRIAVAGGTGVVGRYVVEWARGSGTSRSCSPARTASISQPAPARRASRLRDEFLAQLLRRTRRDGVARVPSRRVQTVAARSVARVPVDVAEGAPGGMLDVAGPEVAELPRSGGSSRLRGLDLRVELDDARPLPADALLPSARVCIEGPTFAAWLAREDAQAIEP